MIKESQFTGEVPVALGQGVPRYDWHRIIEMTKRTLLSYSVIDTILANTSHYAIILKQYSIVIIYIVGSWDMQIVSDNKLYIQKVGISVWGYRAAIGAISFAAFSPACKVSHFSFHILNEGVPSTWWWKYNAELGAHNGATAERSFRLSSWSGPQPERSSGNCCNNSDTIIWVTQESTVRQDRCRNAARWRITVQFSKRDNLIKGNVNFNVSNPKSEVSFGRNLHTTNIIVPEPSYCQKIDHWHGNNCSMSSNRHCKDHKKNKDYF